MIKEWFTAPELADLSLNDMPTTNVSILAKAKRENWQNRPRQASGGGKEYHISSLPEAARVELARRNMKANVHIKGSELQILTSMNGLNQKQKTKAEARLVLVRQLEEFTANADLSLSNAAEKFSIEYEAGNIPVEDWVKVLIPNFSGRTLLRWKANSKELNTLGDKRGQHRKGQSKIDQNPEMHDLIVGMLYEFYDVSCKHIMRALRATFPGSALPSYRRVQAWVANYKNENASILMAIQAPDKFKNKYQAAAGSRSEDVIALNQLWEFDSTPTDVMLADGKRHNIIGVIDVYSRRLKLHVSRTSKASAVVSLLRRAVLDWGVPQFAKLDNGADYKSRY
ncbi:MAG: DNA-binding protein, partial [Alphaproteobacteria bacterium]